MEREQVHLYLGHPGITRKHPDFYRLLVMDHVLGTGPGFTDRISKKLRDEMGLCYAVSASIAGSAGREPGYFACYIGASPDQEERALAALLAEIRAMRKTPPTDEEIQTVRDYLSGSFVLGLERNSSLAAFLIRVERFELGFEYIERYPEIIRSVTPEEARAAAEQHLDPDHYVLVSAGPPPKLAEKARPGPRAKVRAAGRSA
jgi:zinc protease